MLLIEDSDTLARSSMIYLNRLSDYLYLLGAYENHLTGAEVIDWIPEK